jgi:hypothetical protein
MEKKNLLGTVVGVAVSLAVLFGVIYVGGKAWKSSQK